MKEANQHGLKEIFANYGTILWSLMRSTMVMAMFAL
jgi:hypothetical protein